MLVLGCLFLSSLLLLCFFIYKPKLEKKDIVFYSSFVIFSFLETALLLSPRNGQTLANESMSMIRDFYSVYFSYFGAWYFFMKRNINVKYVIHWKRLIQVVLLILSLFLLLHGTEILLRVFQIDIPLLRLIAKTNGI